MSTSNGGSANGNSLGNNIGSLISGAGNLSCSVATAVGGTGGSGRTSSWGCQNSQMDALVTDLSHALDESQTLQRKRRPFRRRVNQPKGNGCCSDYSSSSAEDAMQTGGANSQDNKSSMHLTDSDEGINRCARVPRYRSSRSLRPPRSSVGVVESDSVNESFSPASRPANMRRKPKCKRLALDVTGESVNTAPSRNARWRTAPVVHRVHALHTPARWSVLCGGKRKRSREGGGSESRGEGDELLISSWAPTIVTTAPTRCSGAEAGSTSTGGSVRSRSGGRTSRRGGGGGECSVSSDDSDGGALAGDGGETGQCEVFTCDEGREADDEQSDWVTEGPGPVYGVPSPSAAMNCDEGGLCSTLYSSRLRFQKIRERILRREIRAGKRRLRDRRPGYSISASSVSESVTRFLQDPQASELQLQPSSVAEQDELQRLAQLYSLHLRVGEDEAAGPPQHSATNSCFVTKTRNTLQQQQQQQQQLAAAPFSSLGLPPVSGAASSHPKDTSPCPNFSSLVQCSQSPSALPPALQALSQEALTGGCSAGASEVSFPWGLPIPLSDASKKRRKVPTSPSLIYTFSSSSAASHMSSANAGKGSDAVGGSHFQETISPSSLAQRPNFAVVAGVEEAVMGDISDQPERREREPFCDGEVEMAG